MSRTKTNIKKYKDVKSNIVSSIIKENSENYNVGAVEKSNITSKVMNFTPKNKNDQKVVTIACVVIGVVIVFLAVSLIIRGRKNEKPNTETESLYDIAYKEMKFKEQDNLKKLTCSKTTTEEGTEIKEEEKNIYYFDGNEIDTIIYHTDITVSDAYMDYYDDMYNAYSKSLETDYKYDNVDTNLTKGKNRLLVTIITYNKREGQNKLGTPSFVNYEDARKSSVDNGYSCD